MKPRRGELVDDLSEWLVSLTTGVVVRVWAHAYAEEESMVVFTALMEGSPCFEVRLVEFPKAAVSGVLSA